ncbi:Hsp70 family chaperone [Pyrenophora seminiperda CCB06]|uniref:Hsp70 family chaperone n=1 Tax=Pyrenophora seminiperda CCB06 TaxID=1302712 RepID=A0A3M7MGV8_9PLEO|nr:Hsp70 family chaperone [Pyrenophora seminiperda CCB06]
MSTTVLHLTPRTYVTSTSTSIMLGNRLVVSIDYGTTFTGVAFCETSDTGIIGKTIALVQDWPSCNNKIATKEKVPSELALGDHSKWGALIPSKAQRHMWTKLLLDDQKAGEVDKILEELSLSDNADMSKKPVDIIAQFLAHVKVHLFKNLDIHYDKDLWRTLPLTLVVTVPAVWSDAAKHSTLQAVHKAGFNKVELPQLKRTMLTTEPEAAAIYTIQSMQGGIQDEQFSVGDGFVVCDMGGGTVDLISYRVTGLLPTTLEEATVGSGAQCGGSFVERSFLEWLERRLGTADFVLIAGERSEELPRTSLSSKLGKMVQDFVFEAKSGFSGVETTFLRLPFPLSSIEDDEIRGIQDGEIMITPDDMEGMFAFCLARTYELLREQFQRAKLTGDVIIKHVIMVGGFSESPYMFAKLSSFILSKGLRPIRPKSPWGAIARGAVAKGLEGDGRTQIKNRKCRRYYGSAYSIPFIPGKHRESDSYISEFEGIKRATNQAEWMLKKGQDLAVNATSHGSFTLHQDFWPSNLSRVASLDLLASDPDKAPHRSKDPTVYKVASLEVDLSSVPQSAFTFHRSLHNDPYYSLNFQLEMVIQSSLEFSLLVNGIRYGTVTANYA